MTFNVTVRQMRAALRLNGGQTILQAALATGFPYPHGCKSGLCGTCKSRLIAGRVNMAPYSAMALSEDEAAAGLILACRSVPLSDCEIAVLAFEEVAT